MRDQALGMKTSGDEDIIITPNTQPDKIGITFCLNSLILCWNDDSKLCFPSCFLILDSPLNQESNPVVEPPQPPVVIDEATRIRISVPNPKELWKYIVVQVQNLVPRELDILKSIVYGGLIESITSLGVVSSAIASGASTRKYT